MSDPVGSVGQEMAWKKEKRKRDDEWVGMNVVDDPVTDD